MDFLDILREKAFLGREFLTWLWYKSDRSGGLIEVPGKETMEVLFLDRMTLDLSEVDTPQVVALKGEQSQLREGMAALREGKKIEEARLSIRRGDNEFTMVLKGTWFSFGSFRTPAVLPQGEAEPDESTEGAFLEKTYLLEQGLQAVDDLFGFFLSIRTSDRWEAEEVPAIRRWIKTAE